MSWNTFVIVRKNNKCRTVRRLKKFKRNRVFLKRQKRNGMSKPLPLYWFKEYWIHALYCDGLESRLKRCKRRLPVIEKADEKSDGDISTQLFRWVPIMSADEFDLKSGEVTFRLEARVKKEGNEFVPIIELRRKNRNEEFKVFACRSFEIGDAITFVSKLEEGTGTILLGGICARVVDDFDDCNAYLALNRVLRCARHIHEGDEIVRYSNGDGTAVEYFERIDRVVVFPDTMLVGRIGTERLDEKGSSVVHLIDNSKEVVKKTHRIGYVYRENEV